MYTVQAWRYRKDVYYSLGLFVLCVSEKLHSCVSTHPTRSSYSTASHVRSNNIIIVPFQVVSVCVVHNLVNNESQYCIIVRACRMHVYHTRILYQLTHMHAYNI